MEGEFVLELLPGPEYAFDLDCDVASNRVAIVPETGKLGVVGPRFGGISSSDTTLTSATSLAYETQS